MSKLSPILQMFYGERGAEAKMKFTQSYSDALEELCISENKFRDKLNDYPELLNEFDNYYSKIENLLIEEVDITYCEGFSFGVLLGLDIAEKSVK